MAVVLTCNHPIFLCYSESCRLQKIRRSSLIVSFMLSHSFRSRYIVCCRVTAVRFLKFEGFAITGPRKLFVPSLREFWAHFSRILESMFLVSLYFVWTFERDMKLPLFFLFASSVAHVYSWVLFPIFFNLPSVFIPCRECIIVHRCHKIRQPRWKRKHESQRHHCG